MEGVFHNQPSCRGLSRQQASSGGAFDFIGRNINVGHIDLRIQIEHPVHHFCQELLLLAIVLWLEKIVDACGLLGLVSLSVRDGEGEGVRDCAIGSRSGDGEVVGACGNGGIIVFFPNIEVCYTGVIRIGYSKRNVSGYISIKGIVLCRLVVYRKGKRNILQRVVISNQHLDLCAAVDLVIDLRCGFGDVLAGGINFKLFNVFFALRRLRCYPRKLAVFRILIQRQETLLRFIGCKIDGRITARRCDVCMIRIRKARLSIRPAGGFKDMGAIKRAGDGQLVLLAKNDLAVTGQTVNGF